MAKNGQYDSCSIITLNIKSMALIWSRHYDILQVGVHIWTALMFPLPLNFRLCITAQNKIFQLRDFSHTDCLFLIINKRTDTTFMPLSGMISGVTLMSSYD